MNIIAGTAGHIDHGKTALVKALTGTDTDRLPEEKQRGITIDLGFAEVDLGEARVGFVDVPGHERFVKNMLAGVGGIDLVLLVIAADEGVMPQTREHFDICRLLNVGAGMVVLTKCDLVDGELLEFVRLEVEEIVSGSFLEGAPVIGVSSKTNAGIPELRSKLSELARHVHARPDGQVPRLPIDRSFTIKGFGTVVTGTLITGEIAVGEDLELLPEGTNVRVRGLQTHGKTVDTARAGQRVAVNLGGINHTGIERGMVLTQRGVLRPTQAFDAEIEVLADAARSLRSRQRVRVHIGTVEALARVQVLSEAGEIIPGEKDLAQLRLERPLVALPGDRFIIRSYSPQVTIAGGEVLDASPKRHRGRDIGAAREFLGQLNKWREKTPEYIRTLLEREGDSGATQADLKSKTGWDNDELQAALGAAMAYDLVVFAGEDHFISRRCFDGLGSKTLDEIDAFHKREPLSKGMLKETLREKTFRHVPADIFREALLSLEKTGKLVQEKDIVRLTSHNLELSGSDKLVYDSLLKIYVDAGVEAPKLDEAFARIGGNREHVLKILRLLLNSGEVVKVSDEFYFTGAVIDALKDQLKTFAAGTPDRLIDVPKFKEIAGISRKYAIPLLEYFDREKVTHRAGDKRLVL